jgi:S-adenosylmethionine hydrolase
MSSPIALLTDFGLDDWYVGVMKGVILSINPGVTIVDLTHSVPRHDIGAANFAVLASYRYLPAGAVVVVVVDPGVGGERSFVFPDNGVLTELLDREGYDQLVRVENPEFFLEPVSSTFHGRDIFAPVAAHLTLGVGIERLGPAVTRYRRIEIAQPETGKDRATTRIRWVDRFGNLITDCPAGMAKEMLGRWGGLSLDLGGGRKADLVAAYGKVPRGCPLGIIGSSGYLEISVREGSAARALGLALGDSVVLRKSQ